MRPPTWFEWLTVLAIVTGPVLALFAQRVLDRIRERRKQRVDLFSLLIATRGAFLSPVHVQALNTIVIVFNRPGDAPIRQAWRAVLEHAVTDEFAADGTATPGWRERYFDLKVDLFQAMAAVVGYEFSGDDLKRQVYTPIGHGVAEAEGMLIRQALAKALAGDALKIKIVP